MMQLNPIASGLLVFVCVLALALSVVLNFLLVFALGKANLLLESYQSKVDPILTKLDSILVLAQDKLVTVGGQTEAILEQGEEMTGNVQERVERTSIVVQRTVNAPLIGINSIWAGLARGVKTFGNLQRDSIAELAEFQRSDRDGATNVPRRVAVGK